jgi:hypothetical protein
VIDRDCRLGKLVNPPSCHSPGRSCLLCPAFHPRTCRDCNGHSLGTKGNPSPLAVIPSPIRKTGLLALPQRHSLTASTRTFLCPNHILILSCYLILTSHLRLCLAQARLAITSKRRPLMLVCWIGRACRQRREKVSIRLIFFHTYRSFP